MFVEFISEEKFTEDHIGTTRDEYCLEVLEFTLINVLHNSDVTLRLLMLF